MVEAQILRQGTSALGTKKHTFQNDSDSQDSASASSLLGNDSSLYADNSLTDNILAQVSSSQSNTSSTENNGALSSDNPTAMSTGVPANAYLYLEWQINGTWGLHADQAWSDYTGAGVLVTDLDDGFQTNNPDFAANYSTSLSYDFVTNKADGAAAGSTDFHGTAVMGEIVGNGAAGNGTVGVAYGAEAFGMRMGFGADGGLNQIQEAYQYALTKGAGVVNNSWGFTDPFSDDFGAVDGDTDFSGISAAMQGYVNNDRAGLGGVLVFAAGNNRAGDDNTNYHNMQNSPYVVTVAAIDSTGAIADFSTPGTSILVSAAGVDVATTNDTQNGGYIPGAAYIYFSGTSAAAPLVTATIALMEQANPNLGWRDIQQILAYSAQYNDPASTTWQYNGATNWNGGGLHYSSDFGFGAANALAAVRLAETWTLQAAPQDSANMLTVNGGSTAPDTAITSSASTSMITVSQNINIEHIEVNLNIADTNLTGLTVTLVAPDGTKSVLINDPANGTNTNSLQFQTATVADWGETSAGQWKLLVQDSATGAAGTLNGWSLTFLGSAVSANHTYIYTNDFGAFSGAALASRSVIHDTSGGIDTLNLATVTSPSTVNLTSGTGTIAGHAVAITAGTTVDNVYGGDGNDTFTGNTGNDYLYGGRGNDELVVMGGHDTINGGAGNDTVVYNESVADFHFTFTGATQQTITDSVGNLGTDTVTNVEDFSFAGATYTLQQLETYAATPSSANNSNVSSGSGSSGGSTGGSSGSSGGSTGGSSGGGSSGGSSGSSGGSTGGSSGGGSSGGSSGSSGNSNLDEIILNFPGGNAITSVSAGTQIYAASSIGGSGSSLAAEIVRDSSGLTLDYLGNSAPKTVTITAMNSSESINLSGTAPTGLSDTINAGGGNDNINIGVLATMAIHTGNGNDTIASTVGADNNTITAGNGADSISVGDGTNKIITGAGMSAINAGNGTNTVIVGGGANTITLGSGHDTITAGGGNNTISAGGGIDTIIVGNGNNTISTGAGHNTIVAGAGNNTVSVVGGTDTITVGTGNNTIYGGAGTGTVTLGSGTDTVSVGNGHYTINAGHGKDIFAFTATGTAASTINHFSSAAGDKIDISAVLTYNDPSSQTISNFVHITAQGSSAVISVDANGVGSHFTALAVVTGVGHLDLESMISNGSLIV